MTLEYSGFGGLCVKFVGKMPPAQRLPRLNADFGALLGRICRAVESFGSFDPTRIAVSLSRSRSQSKYGVWAYVTPLRYVGGSLHRRGRRRGYAGRYEYANERLAAEAGDALYLMTFLVPKFFTLSFEERLETCVHELYHLHPQFRGDLRRFPRPHVHHGPTPAAFKRQVSVLAREALARDPGLRDESLLCQGPEVFEARKLRHLAVPKLRFVPDAEQEAPTWRRWLQTALFGCLCLAALGARAQSSAPPAPGFRPRYVVQTIEPVDIVSSPSDLGQVLGSVKPDESFIAYSKDAESEGWVLLRNRKKQGWVQQRFIRVTAQLNTPQAAAIEDAGAVLPPPKSKAPKAGGDGGEDGDFGDGQTMRYLASCRGEFAESPEPYAERFGLIEKGDRLRIIRRSPDSSWSFVRLELTRTEGWFPSSCIELENIPRITVAGSGLFGVEGDLSFGTQGRNFGGGGSAFVDLFWGQQLSKLEIAGFYYYHGGERIVRRNDGGEYSFDVTYQSGGAYLRYVGFNETGYLGGAFELGGVYNKPVVRLEGLDPDVVAETGIKEITEPSYGLMVGGRGLLSLTSFLHANLGARMYLVSRQTVFVAYAGISLRLF
jgi:hypothetical protein